MKRIFFVILLFFSSQISTAQTWQDTIPLIDKIFDRFKPDHPGCQLAISRGGKVIYSKAWGLAELDHQVPMSTTSLIEAGSVSKQFTAASILLLEQLNKLSTLDDVHKYIPELPNYGVPVTLEQMMHHTSGLKDIWGLLALSDQPRGTKVYNNDDVLAILARQPNLNNKPGTEYLYSNSNYILLAIIVERVSKMSLPEFTKQNIFRPAGMTHTQWRIDYRKVIIDKAVAYGKSDNEYTIDMPLENVYGSGGLLTTAEDLLKWNNFYLQGKFGNPSLLTKQLQRVTLANGGRNNYAAGLRIDTIHGVQLISHDGATAGYRSLLEHYSAADISVAWLANTGEFDGKPDGTGELRELLLKKPSTTKPVATVAPKNTPASTSTSAPVFSINQKKLMAYVADYYSGEVEAKLKLSIVDGFLTVHRSKNQKFRLIPLSADTFKIEDSNVKAIFKRDKRGQVTALEFTTPRVRNVAFNKQ